MGGNFTVYNGTARSRIARLNTNGTLDTGFNPGSGANNVVFSVVVQGDGKILIGGDVSDYNGTITYGIARLNTNGTLDTGFDSGFGTNSTVRSIALQADGKVLIGGAFILYNHTTRNRIARLSVNGMIDTDFDPVSGANNPVNSVVVQTNGKILIGGEFTTYYGMSRNYITRIVAQPCTNPVPNFTTMPVCLGSPTTLTDASSNVAADATYAWDVDNDGTVEYTTKGSISHTYATAGSFTAKLTITQGTCQVSFTQPVTVNEIPQSPGILTSNGQPYPGGVSSLTASQNTGNVILTVSGCEGGVISWAGGSATALAVSTSNTGVFSYSATCSRNDCTSPAATATVTIVPQTLKVLSRDPDNGQLSSNTIKPYLLLQNVGTTPIAYQTITVRYWLTTENSIPLLFQKNYVQIGAGNLQLHYVPLSPARGGATGYIEYSFTGGAASLIPMSNSGPIETQVYKQNYSAFNQLDDYSYINNSAFTLNPRITAYINGVLFYGVEPGLSGGSPRQGVAEAEAGLQVRILGNPVVGSMAEVEISGVSSQSVQVELVDLQGRLLHQQRIGQASVADRVRVPVGSGSGVLLLQVSTATQRQQLKLLKP